ncbi:MAG: hypothetical protein O7C58_05205 [Rickettsia endosymbiont of Ixodes persulcatus]|nr:hypothetical protein [Rickettsia endosymbiont of Ixodes persulcatus]
MTEETINFYCHSCVGGALLHEARCHSRLRGNDMERFFRAMQ